MSLEEFLTPPPDAAPSYAEGDDVVSAGRFAARVEACARGLRARGLEPGDRVAIVAAKSVATVALVFAVLREGGVFVPVDPKSPPRRLAAILEDCAPRVIAVDATTGQAVRELGLTGVPIAELAPAEDGADSPATRRPRTGPRALFPTRYPGTSIAYLIYTSGSTGEPKGVAVPRDALAGFLRSARERAGYDRDTVFLSFFPLHFDPVLMEIFVPWAVGGRSVLFPGMQMINDLLQALRKHEVTDFSCTPNVVSMLVGRFSSLHRKPLPSLRSVWMGGEHPSTPDSRTFQRLVPGVRLFNGYGPTECVVACSLYELPDLADLPDDYRIPIGRPMPGVRFLVVDGQGNEIEDEQARGHLLIGGAQLMTGYWGERVSAQDVFVQRPDGPYYRTGDLVERDENGEYRFAGRSSRMIKIGGFRVHPAEVESALLTLPGVSAAVVVHDEERNRLIAVVEAPSAIEVDDCVSHLEQRVPSYMLPARVVVVDRLPRLTSGKIDLGGVRTRALAPAR